MKFHCTITSIEQIVQLAVFFRRWWFRGHNSTYGTLLPKAYRSRATGHRGPGFEEPSSFHTFRRQAQGCLPRAEWPASPIDWLMMMQHFGVSTRLLDWTSNALVACYFAVRNLPAEDGELWVLQPQQLNWLTYKQLAFADPNGGHVDFLVRDALIFDPEPSRRHKQIAPINEEKLNPLAFEPPHLFARISAQHGKFTIHPRHEPLQDIAKCKLGPATLYRYRIPKENKARLMLDLDALGFNLQTMFRGELQTLAESVAAEFVRPDTPESHPDAIRFCASCSCGESEGVDPTLNCHSRVGT